MRFSVIIPVYNIADYLEDCVRSVLDQTFDDFEIILIDDGSTDGKTSQLVDEWRMRDQRILAIHQPNTGVSAARNAGIRASSGEYILFLDGDDYYGNPQFLDVLDSAIDRISADCYVVPYTRVARDGKRRHEPIKTLPAEEIVTDTMTLVQSGMIRTPVYTKILPRNYYTDSHLFPTGMKWGEDALWCKDLITDVRSFVYIDCPNYMYNCDVLGSTTNSISYSHIQDMLHLFRSSLGERDDAIDVPLKVYLSIYYIHLLFEVYPYRSDPEIKAALKTYSFLTSYGLRLDDYSYKLVALFIRVCGLTVAMTVLFKIRKYLLR